MNDPVPVLAYATPLRNAPGPSIDLWVAAILVWIVSVATATLGIVFCYEGVVDRIAPAELVGLALTSGAILAIYAEWRIVARRPIRWARFATMAAGIAAIAGFGGTCAVALSRSGDVPVVIAVYVGIPLFVAAAHGRRVRALERHFP